MSDVTVVIGAGQIGQAIARRVSAGKHVVLADLQQTNADAAAEVLADAGFDVSTATGDVPSRESVHALAEAAAALGDVTGLIHAAGVSPADELRALPMLQPDQVTDTLHAYQLAKRGNSLRVMAEAVRWGRRGGRVNTISPGIIITPLAPGQRHRSPTTHRRHVYGDFPQRSHGEGTCRDIHR